jgi:hypothetical protein
MSARSLRPLVVWAPFAAICALAFAAALFTTPAPSAPHAAPEAMAKAAANMGAHEADFRKTSAKEFPTDPWSQDDAFHEKEAREARSYAGSHSLSLGEVLDATDADLRARAARGDSTFVATVPPCHPRAIY